MALIFMDGFDHYDTAHISSKWPTQFFAVGGGTPATMTVNTNGRVSPGKCLRYTGGSVGANCICYIGRGTPSLLEGIIGFAFKFSQLPGADYSLLMLNEGIITQATLSLNFLDGSISWRRGSVTSTPFGTLSVIPTVGAWNYLEIKFRISDSISANSCVVKLNGITALTLAAGTDTNVVSGTPLGVSGLILGYWHTSGSTIGTGFTCDYDDFYILDLTGSVNNNFIGDRVVETLYPTGAGTITQWTPSTGANYTCVDENPPTDDTDYVSTATVGQKDTYAFGDLAGTPLSIAGVQVNLMTRKTDGGVRQVAAVTRSGGTDYDGPTQNVTDGYGVNASVREVDPATSVAWTTAGVNAVEAGVKLIA